MSLRGMVSGDTSSPPTAAPIHAPPAAKDEKLKRDRRTMYELSFCCSRVNLRRLGGGGGGWGRGLTDYRFVKCVPKPSDPRP